VTFQRVPASGSSLSCLVDQVAVNRRCGPSWLETAFSIACRSRRDRVLEEVGRTVEGVHVLVDHPPHVPALGAMIHFTPPPGLGVILASAVDHLVRAERRSAPLEAKPRRLSTPLLEEHR